MLILFYNIERDAFDTLLDHAPDKLNVVKTVKNLASKDCIYALIYYKVLLVVNYINFTICHPSSAITYYCYWNNLRFKTRRTKINSD